MTKDQARAAIVRYEDRTSFHNRNYHLGPCEAMAPNRVRCWMHSPGSFVCNNNPDPNDEPAWGDYHVRYEARRLPSGALRVLIMNFDRVTGCPASS